MKKIFLVFCVFLFAASLCFAQKPAAVTKPAAPQAPAVNVVIGQIKSVTLENGAKGIKPAIVVSESAGNEASIMVMPATVISDKDGKQIAPDKLVVGDKVRVKYTQTREGVKEAVKIKITP